MNSKKNQFTDFTSKVLSRRGNFVEPFPKNIHQLIGTYLQFLYWFCLVPYRIIFNKTNGQYEAHSNLFHKTFYAINWSVFTIQFVIAIAIMGSNTKKDDPLNILLLLGGVGHLMNIIVFIFTSIFGKAMILDLLNFLVIGTSGSYKQHDTPSAMLKFPGDELRPHTLLPLAKGKMRISFKTIAIGIWTVSLIAGIRCMAFITRYLEETQLFFSYEDSFLFHAMDEAQQYAPKQLLEDSTSYWYWNVIFATTTFTAYYNVLSSILIYGMEVIVVLTMKYICCHFTDALDSNNSWKPSSHTVLSSFLLVRQACKMINRIFGWLFFITVMGEFPSITISLVFLYRNPGANVQLGYKIVMFYEILLLYLSVSVVLELSKLKQWLHFGNGEKQKWAGLQRGSLQRRIVLFELSLNKCALYGHGFFQMSLPACVSIAVGILSNAMIILQLALST